MILVILFFLFGWGVLFAQKIPAPDEVLGFKPGADYKLATYEQALEYWRILEKASPMIKLFEAGKTEMGKPFIYAVISSEENMSKLDYYKEISKKLAKVKGLTDEEALRLAKEGKAIAWIDGGIHGGECSGAQGFIQFAYNLLTSKDEETLFILDNTIVLLVFPNPEGMNLIADWYLPNVGTQYEKSPMPWLYNKYVGHDKNRDSFMNNLKETQIITRLINDEWFPVALCDHHGAAPYPARIWIPPAAEPTNQNLHPLFLREKNLLGSGITYHLDRHGKAGAISRLVYDFIYPGYEDSFVDYFNIPSILCETSQNDYASPREFTIDDFPEAERDFLVSAFYPNPWKPGWWRFGDAVEYTLITNKGFLHTIALCRKMFLYGRYQMGKDTIAKFETEPPYAWIIPKEQWDVPTAAALVDGMRFAGLDVYEAEEAFECDGRSYPSGTWVIPMSQPFSRFVKACWEKQVYPDLVKYPKQWQGIVSPQVFEDAYLPPYDMAGWTLPYQFGVKVEEAQTPLKAKLKPLEKVVPPEGKVEGSGRYYLICPKVNNSYKALNRILKNKGKVMRTQDSFEAEGKSYPAGTIIVRSVSELFMDSLAKELFLNIGKANEIPVKTYNIKAPRIALYKSWVANMDEGWTRWLLERYEFPFKNIFDADIRAGDIAKKYDVLIIPSIRTDAVVDGHKKEAMPEKYVGGITEAGVENIKTFIKEGGTLVALRQGCLFAIDKLGIPISDALKDLRAPERQSGNISPKASAVKFACPGSLLRMKFDSKHPVAYGMPEEAPAMFYQSTAFNIESSEGIQPKVISKYPDGELLLSGFFIGGKYLNNKPAAVDVPCGKGRVVLLGFGVQNRAQSVGTFKLLFNSLYYSVLQ